MIIIYIVARCEGRYNFKYNITFRQQQCRRRYNIRATGMDRPRAAYAVFNIITTMKNSDQGPPPVV